MKTFLTSKNGSLQETSSPFKITSAHKRNLRSLGFFFLYSIQNFYIFVLHFFARFSSDRPKLISVKHVRCDTHFIYFVRVPLKRALVINLRFVINNFFMGPPERKKKHQCECDEMTEHLVLSDLMIFLVISVSRNQIKIKNAEIE